MQYSVITFRAAATLSRILIFSKEPHRLAMRK